MKGQVAVVTAGGTGVGRAIAIALAGAGSKVALVARTEAPPSETVTHPLQLGAKAMCVTADVTQRDKVERAAAAVQSRLGPVDRSNGGGGFPHACSRGLSQLHRSP